MTPAWPEVALGDVCEIISGATPKTSTPEYWDGETRWATPKDLSDLDAKYISDTPRRLTEAGLRSCAATVLPPGSLLLSSRAPIGLTAINTVPMATNQGFKSLIPRHDLLDVSYLYWWAVTHRRLLESLGRGATFKEISKAITADVSIPLPPIEDQRRIAAILDQADELRAKRRASLDLLDSLTESIFLDMFGDPRTNSRRWPLRAFAEVCPTRLGKMLDQKRQKGDQKRAYLRNANVRWFTVDLSDLAEMDFDAGDRTEFRLEVGDVLICEGGEPGRAAVWDAPVSEMYFQKAVHRGRPDLHVVTPNYIVHLLWHLARSGALVDHISTATIAHLTGQRLKAMKIPVPDIDTQREFDARLAEGARERDRLLRGGTELDDLFASLQHRAFRGEL